MHFCSRDTPEKHRPQETTETGFGTVLTQLAFGRNHQSRKPQPDNNLDQLNSLPEGFYVAAPNEAKDVKQFFLPTPESVTKQTRRAEGLSVNCCAAYAAGYHQVRSSIMTFSSAFTQRLETYSLLGFEG